MSRTIRLALLACAVAFSTSGYCEDGSKNPLVKPKSARVDSAPAGGNSLPPAPGMKDPLPTASISSGPATAASHLAGLRVVATIGNKAILRGTLGKTGNLALSGDEPRLSGTPLAPIGANIGDATAPADKDEKPSAVRTVTVTHGEPLQLAENIWVRPEINGPVVRLFLQTSSKERTEALIYSSGVEIADNLSPTLYERSFDSKKDKQAK